MTVTAIKRRPTNNPQGLYWMRSQSGIEMQVRAEEVVMAEPINGEGMCAVFLQHYDKDHMIKVWSDIGDLYNRPVQVGTGGTDEN